MKRDQAPGAAPTPSTAAAVEPAAPRRAAVGSDVAKRLAAVERRASAHDEAIRALLKIVGELGGKA